jgi:hypothetical protein
MTGVGERTFGLVMTGPRTEAGGRFARSHFDLVMLDSFLWGIALKLAILEDRASGQWRELVDDDARLAFLTRAFQRPGLGLAVVSSTLVQRPLLEMLLARAADSFVAYLADLLRLIFTHCPERMRDSRERVEIDVLIDCESRDEIVAALATARVSGLATEGGAKLRDYFWKGLGFRLFTDEGVSSRVGYALAARNLIVHNRGVVNRRFLRAVGNSSVPIGEPLILDTAGVMDHVDVLARSVLDIDDRAAAAFGLPRSQPRASAAGLKPVEAAGASGSEAAAN